MNLSDFYVSEIYARVAVLALQPDFPDGRDFGFFVFREPARNRRAVGVRLVVNPLRHIHMRGVFAVYPSVYRFALAADFHFLPSVQRKGRVPLGGHEAVDRTAGRARLRKIGVVGDLDFD